MSADRGIPADGQGERQQAERDYYALWAASHRQLSLLDDFDVGQEPREPFIPGLPKGRRVETVSTNGRL